MTCVSLFGSCGTRDVFWRSGDGVADGGVVAVYL